MSFKLRGKEIFYVIEATIRDYAWINRVNSSTTPRTEGSKSTSSIESDMEELTFKFEELGGSYNLERKRAFERDQAKAFHVISMSLGQDDKRARGEYELNIKGFWTSLKVKYQQTSTASIYMTKIQTFIFDEEKGIFVAWAKLKEYHHKVIAADSNLKATYPDAAVFLILYRSLPSSFKPLTRAFVAQPTLSIEEKIDMLVEHEMDLREEGLNAEKAHIAKSNTKASKHRQQKRLEDSNKKKPSRSSGKKLTRKSYGYQATALISDDESELLSNCTSSDEDIGTVEV
jgi:hypothetical protein